MHDSAEHPRIRGSYFIPVPHSASQIPLGNQVFTMKPSSHSAGDARLIEKGTLAPGQTRPQRSEKEPKCASRRLSLRLAEKRGLIIMEHELSLSPGTMKNRLFEETKPASRLGVRSAKSRYLIDFASDWNLASFRKITGTSPFGRRVRLAKSL